MSVETTTNDVSSNETKNNETTDETKNNETNVIITIDLREHELIQLAHAQHIPIQTMHLPVGDILIQKDDQVLVFERKTMADLAASIKDGRYSEQRQRLKSTYPFHRITFLIEGSTTSLRTQPTTARIASKAIVSALISSQYRDGFHVHHTSNLTETLWYIQEVSQRMGEKTQFQAECKEEYGASLRVKTIKRDNVTPELCYLLQLSQLPGISMTTATEIAKTYPTMRTLLHAIDEKGGKAFSAIDGMGPKRAKLFCEYFQ